MAWFRELGLARERENSLSYVRVNLWIEYFYAGIRESSYFHQTYIL